MRQFGHLFHELWISLAHATVASNLDLINLLSSCGNLKKLRCGGHFDEDGNPPLIVTAECCPLLEDLDLRDILSPLTVLSGFINSCKHITKLSWSGTDLLDPFIYFIANIRKLKQLSLSCREGLTPGRLAVITTMTLDSLSLSSRGSGDWFTVASLQSFAGTNLSRSLTTISIEMSS